jgi:tetratricopeptide (TPR) repeat protein
MALSHLSQTVKVFLSYAQDSPEDRVLFDKLMKQLSVYKRQGNIEIVSGASVHAGSDRRRVINAYITEADIIVFLVSADLMASEYYYEAEVKRAFERRDRGIARVVSVLLRPTVLGPPLDTAYFISLDGGKPISQCPNKDAAFVEVANKIFDIAEEIRHQSGESQLRIEGAQPLLWHIPYRRNPFFTSREDTLAILHKNFTTNQSSDISIQALTGLGGIGKTQIAIEYAYRHQQDYQTVFWLGSASREILRAELLYFADSLSIPEKERIDEAHLFEAIKRWLERHADWLLLLDNLEDLSLVNLFTPARCYGRGHILLTACVQATGALALSIPVTSLTVKESADFLLHRAKIIAPQVPQDEASIPDKDSARAIAQALDGYPLALDQAGAYIEETQRPLGDYLAFYHQRRVDLLKRRGEFPDCHPKSVSATLSLAFEQVARKHQAAMELLRLFAFLHPDAIPEKMIAQGMVELSDSLQALVRDPLAFDSTIALLRRFSLIRHYTDTTALSMHRVVQAVLRDALLPEEQCNWAMTVVRLVNRAFPDGRYSTWAACQRYLPQAQHCTELVMEFHLELAEASELLHHLGTYCYECADYRDAERYFTHAIALREKTVGAEHFDTAQSLYALALLYSKLGRYQQAEQLYQRTLIVCEQLFGPDHVEVAHRLNGLAFVSRRQGKYDQAEALYQRVLAINEQTIGFEHIDTATTFNNLALLYHEQGKYALAESLYLRSLRLRESLLPVSHPNIAQSINNLALLYRVQGKYHQAEALYQRALIIREQALGPEHPDTALVLNNLGRLYRIQGAYQRAEPFLKRALTIREQVLGPEHPDTAQSLNNLAELLTFQADYQQAETLFHRALEIRRHVLGPEHPDVAIVLESYALLLERTGRGEKAQEARTRADSIKSKYSC